MHKRIDPTNLAETKTLMLNICVRRSTLQHFVPEVVRCAAALLVLMFCGIASSSLCAQDQKPAEKVTAAPPVEQKSPTPTPTPTVSASMTPSVPLTIVQIRTNLPAAPAERFEFLRRQRKSTLDAIDEASSQLKTLTTSMSLLQQQKDALSAWEDDHPLGITREQREQERKHASDDLTQANEALNAAKTKRGVSDAEVQLLQSDVRKKADRLEALDNSLVRLKEDEKRHEEAEDALKRVTDELVTQGALRDKTTQLQLSYQRLLGEIDDMVNQEFISSDATNSFKLKMSIAFAILIAVVIAGFFWIAFSNDDVKKAIFSNEAGIQFITMFAIVIAVILFGIIGILEGKELSALLGGLSGYILGKTRA